MNELIDDKTLSHLKLLQLKSKKRFLNQRHGTHKSLKRGQGFDFADHGSYQPGDDIRYIDWNIFARSEKLYIKRFQEEEDLRVISIIDDSESMFVDNKWLLASKLSFALAHIAIMQGDRFYISSDSGVTQTYSNYSQLKNLSDYLLNKSKGSSFKENSSVLSALKYPGVVFYFSDFLFPISKTRDILNTLLLKNMDVICVQILGENEKTIDKLPSQSNLFDLETNSELKLNIDNETKKEYKKLMHQHINSLKTLCQSSQISFISVSSSDDTIDVLRKAFLNKGLLEY